VSHSHHHPQEDSCVSTQKLTLAFWITFVFGLVEIGGGSYSRSLALKSDGYHMLADAFALGLSWLGIKYRHKHAKLEYGVTLVNGVFVVLVALQLTYKSIERFSHPEPIDLKTMLSLSVLGFIVNLMSAKLLHSDQVHSLNVKSAYLHVLGDLLGSLGAIVAGGMIYFLAFK
jgi:cobalt-zinc-cadmium efflux system protein